jgi:hypothetical protein
MSLFLIVYDREAGRLVDLHQFSPSQGEAAVKARLELELGASPSTEVVILEAESESQLRTTHARYFGDEAVDALASEEKSRLIPQRA